MAIQTKFDICSRALTRVGANPIASFDEGTAEAIVAGREYDEFAEARLSAFPWRFATDLVSLGAPLTDTPASKWSFAYQEPADLLVLRGVFRDDNAIVYDRFGDKIFCEEDAGVVAEFTFHQVEARWPPYFRDALTVELASVFALGLARDKVLSDSLFEQAHKVLWPRARSTDSQQQTTRQIKPSRLTGIRL